MKCHVRLGAFAIARSHFVARAYRHGSASMNNACCAQEVLNCEAGCPPCSRFYDAQPIASSRYGRLLPLDVRGSCLKCAAQLPRDVQERSRPYLRPGGRARGVARSQMFQCAARPSSHGVFHLNTLPLRALSAFREREIRHPIGLGGIELFHATFPFRRRYPQHSNRRGIDRACEPFAQVSNDNGGAYWKTLANYTSNPGWVGK